MRHGAVIIGALTVIVGACAGPSPSRTDGAPPPSTPAAAVSSEPSSEPTIEPTIEPTSGPPSLTPLLPAGGGAGAWTAVEGSGLVGPNAVAVAAGDGGVLFVSDALDPRPDGSSCEQRERGGVGPMAFFDATTGTISAVPGDVGLQGSVLASLPDGRVMAVGGVDPRTSDFMPSERTRIWDPDTRAWSEAAPLAVGSIGPYLLTLADGRLLSLGGEVAEIEEDCEDCTTTTDAAAIYDPVIDRWTPTARLELTMPDTEDLDDLEGALSLAGGAVLALGSNDSAALFDPGTETWSALDWQGGWTSGMVALPDGSALTFRVDFPESDDLDAELPVATRFEPAGATTTVGHWSPPDYATVTALSDGRVLIAGGVVEDSTGYLGDFLDRAAVFDPESATLSEVASMPGPRAMSSAVPLADGSVLVAGGIDVWETVPGTDGEEGTETPGCVPRDQRVIRWQP